MSVVTPPGNFKYCLPGELLTPSVATAEAGTVSIDPEYGLTSLYDRNLIRPCKFTDNPAQVIILKIDMGSAVRIEGVAIPMSDLTSNLAVRVDLTTSGGAYTWPGTSRAMTVGPRDQMNHSATPWADFTDVVGNNRYVWIYIPANDAVVAIGEVLVMGKLHTFSQWPQFGTRGIARQWQENVTTEYGMVRGLERRLKQRKVRFTLKGNDQDYIDLQNLADNAGGRAHPFFVGIDANARTDNGMLVRFSEASAKLLEAPETWFNLNELTIDLIEESRGIPFV